MGRGEPRRYSHPKTLAAQKGRRQYLDIWKGIHEALNQNPQKERHDKPTGY